jgi:hypothetical protein
MNFADATKEYPVASTTLDTRDDAPDSLDVDNTPNDLDSIPPHPLRVKPSGNQYSATDNSRDSTGPSFGTWPDEILALFLEYLEPRDLLLLGSACKYLHAFCRSDDLWKALFLE